MGRRGIRRFFFFVKIEAHRAISRPEPLQVSPAYRSIRGIIPRVNIRIIEKVGIIHKIGASSYKKPFLTPFIGFDIGQDVPMPDLDEGGDFIINITIPVIAISYRILVLIRKDIQRHLGDISDG